MKPIAAPKSARKIAISGTYSSGKTTTTEALALLTGIPRTQARTMREIIRDTMPGKILEQCSPSELSELGLLRFRDRMINEAKIQGKYFSDGSCLHEWIYGQGRMKMGIAPGESLIKKYWTIAKNLKSFRGYVAFMEVYGAVAKHHAKLAYDLFIHLPIEFELVEDGHRPVSEEFRALTDQLLRDTLDEIGMPYFLIQGSLEERLTQIVELLSLQPKMDIQAAIAEAKEIVERDAVLNEAYIHQTLQQKRA